MSHIIISTSSPTLLSTLPTPPDFLCLVNSLAAEKWRRISVALAQPNANATFLFTEIAARANAIPTCRAAHTNIIRCDSASPIGVSVLPVPVGAIYRINLGFLFLHDVKISFWCSYNSMSEYFNKLLFFSINSTAFSIITDMSTLSPNFSSNPSISPPMCRLIPFTEFRRNLYNVK